MSVMIRQDLFRVGTLMWPNKPLEPTAIIAVGASENILVRLVAVTP